MALPPNKNRIVLLGICAVVIVMYFIFVIANVNNIPRLDDYDILNFINTFFNGQNSLAESLQLLLGQVNEHRSVLYKGLALGQYGLTGLVNFSWLAVLGNLPLIGVLYYIALSLKHKEWQAQLILLSALLIFQPQHWENIFLAEAAFANYLVLMLSFAAIVQMNKNIYRALFLACLATFTNANGMFVFVPMLLYVLVNKDQNWWKLCIVWIMVMGVYFWGYEHPPHHQEIMDAIFVHPWGTLEYILCLLVSFLAVGRDASLVIGGAVLIAYIGVAVKFFQKGKSSATYYIFLLMLTTLLIIALGRSGFTYIQAFSSRYTLYSLLTFLSCLVLIMDHTDLRFRNKMYWTALILASLFYITGWTYFPKLVDQKQMELRDGMRDWLANNRSDIEKGTFNEPSFQPDNTGLYYYKEDYTDEEFLVLQRAISKNIYVPDESD